MKKVQKSILNSLKNNKNFVWHLFQQVFSRGILGVKFLISALLLGPAEFGIASIILMSLAIIESITLTGIQDAVIQDKGLLNSEKQGAILSYQFLRGIIIAITLLISAKFTSTFFGINNSVNLIYLLAIVPVLRNLANPSVFSAKRNLDFRKLAFFEVIPASVDLIVTIVLIQLNVGVASLIYSLIISDAIKLIYSWLFFNINIIVNFKLNAIFNLISFGKWIWVNGLLAVILIQFDKVLAAKFLNISDFGVYQFATRINQIIIVEPALIVALYMFPIFSIAHRKSLNQAKDIFNKILPYIFLLIILTSFFMIFISHFFLGLIHADKWKNLQFITNIIILPSIFGALINFLISFLNAINKPNYVTKAVFVQIFFYIFSLILLLDNFKLPGVIISIAIGAASSSFYMLLFITRIKFIKSLS